jgi:hypothetical protein
VASEWDVPEERERERPPERAEPVKPPPRLGSPESLLALQRSAGNQAVRAMLARDPTDTAAPEAAAKTDEQLFDDAVQADDWAKAAELIVKLGKPIDKLTTLSAPQLAKLGQATTVEQLRLLHDAALRDAAALGWTGIFVRVAIRAALIAKGEGLFASAPGAGFGGLTTKVVEKTNAPSAGGTYAYKIEISFLPDTAAVDADEIAFIQTVRLVDTTTGGNLDPEETNQKRQNADARSVDRLGGREQGWYGMTDAGGGGATLTAWKKTDPTKPAFMMDRPSWSVENSTWEFETAVVCRAGTDVGKVYATVTWGFSVDSAGKIVEKDQVVTNKPSAGFTEAVNKWNAQAAGPEADRNAPGQQALPALK